MPGVFQAPGMKGSVVIVPRVNGATEHIYDTFTYIVKYIVAYISARRKSHYKGVKKDLTS